MARHEGGDGRFAAGARFTVAALSLLVIAGACGPDGEDPGVAANSAAAASSTTTAGEPSTTASPTTTAAGYAGTAPPTSRLAPSKLSTTTAREVSPGGSGVPEAERRVEAAKDDLVRRFRHQKADVKVVSIESVTWPNAALGCPRHDREYDQTPVAGYRIVLQWKDVQYRYHGRSGADPFLCQFLD